MSEITSASAEVTPAAPTGTTATHSVQAISTPTEAREVTVPSPTTGAVAANSMIETTDVPVPASTTTPAIPKDAAQSTDKPTHAYIVGRKPLDEWLYEARTSAKTDVWCHVRELKPSHPCYGTHNFQCMHCYHLLKVSSHAGTPHTGSVINHMIRTHGSAGAPGHKYAVRRDEARRQSEQHSMVRSPKRRRSHRSLDGACSARTDMVDDSPDDAGHADPITPTVVKLMAPTTSPATADMMLRVRSAWTHGTAATNLWLSLNSTFTAEISGHAGFDSVTIDLQHGLLDYPMAVHMMQAMSSSSSTILVRPPTNEPGIIGKVLDAGATGIICPLINTRADAERLIQACRYAPHGGRSCGPTRAKTLFKNYHREIENNVIIFAMVETKEAVDNVTAIASTPGLTGIYVGPSDLGVSFGYQPGVRRSEPDVVAALETIVRTCKEHNIHVGIFCDGAAHAREMAGKGFDFVTLTSDVRVFAAGTAQLVKNMHAPEPL
eukprot:m.359806 g.359806  ORF g.359806 m.359806 type:complete len:492 (+) comp20763_c0_seq9:256-1731(+)